MAEIFVFPSGTSFGNTFQLCMSSYSSQIFDETWVICSNETHKRTTSICKYLTSITEHHSFSAKTFDQLEEICNGRGEHRLSSSNTFHLLIAPSTIQYQLQTFAALCRLKAPTTWYLYEQRSTGNQIIKRELNSFQGHQPLTLQNITHAQMLNALKEKERLFLNQHKVGWDNKTSRFTYKIDCRKGTKGKKKVAFRKWQNEHLLIVNKIREIVGVHGLISSHTPIPDYFHGKHELMDRFAAAGIRGGLE